MQCLGEMSTLFPIQGAFIELAGRFVDESLAFSLGWNYWYLWVTNIAGDFNASSIIMGYWTDKVPTYGWVSVLWTMSICPPKADIVWSDPDLVGLLPNDDTPRCCGLG
jgi:yeast amino acid transporter